MPVVVGITFKEKGKTYYFSPGKYKINKNITVIVETERGLQFGKVVTDPIKFVSDKEEVKKIIRIASNQDYKNHLKNLNDARSALKKCRELVKKYNLNMKVLDADYTFNRNQLMFHFISDSRIDFRELAKELAAIYRTRIELRQIGVRDKAKIIGGLGPCGRALCCSLFLDNFDSVSINMAKNQNLSLNPNKINGVCGRLLCCLNYEDETYTKCRQCLPNVGNKIVTERGEGIVVNVDILNRSYKVDVPEVGILELTCKDGSN